MEDMTRALELIANGSCLLTDARRVASEALLGVYEWEPGHRPHDEELVAVVSSSHISRRDSELLTLVEIPDGLPIVKDVRYGQLVHLEPTANEVTIKELQVAFAANGLSPEFRLLWLSMRKRGYTWLHFDHSGEVLQGFRTFTW